MVLRLRPSLVTVHYDHGICLKACDLPDVYDAKLKDFWGIAPFTSTVTTSKPSHAGARSHTALTIQDKLLLLSLRCPIREA